MPERLDRERIRTWVQEQKDALIRLTEELVSIPSENRPPYGREKPVQLLLQSRLRELGFRAECYALSDVPGLDGHPAFRPGRNYDERPNLFARKQGVGGGRSLLFAVHADVVPGIPGIAAEDPFRPRLTNGRLYGRGSNDMKGGIAAALTAFRYFAENGIRLRGDLLFESVVDEEMGGANGTLAGRVRGDRADAAIVPEPSNLRLCTSHLGGTTWRITVKGRGGMGFGGEETLNPIYGISYIVQAIEAYHRRLKHTKTYVNADGSAHCPAVVLSLVHCGNFEPGMADGIPESCLLEVWVECLPGETLEELEREFLGEIRQVCASEPVRPFEVHIERIIRFLPGSEARTPLADVLAGELKARGLPDAHHRAPFACDAFLFNLYSDTPALILGPSGENAHAADEFVDVESLAVLTEVYIAAIHEWCGVNG
jgi:acetylornithine deacetylase